MQRICQSCLSYHCIYAMASWVAIVKLTWNGWNDSYICWTNFWEINYLKLNGIYKVHLHVHLQSKMSRFMQYKPIWKDGFKLNQVLKSDDLYTAPTNVEMKTIKHFFFFLSASTQTWLSFACSRCGRVWGSAAGSCRRRVRWWRGREGESTKGSCRQWLASLQ